MNFKKIPLPTEIAIFLQKNYPQFSCYDVLVMMDKNGKEKSHFLLLQSSDNFFSFTFNKINSTEQIIQSLNTMLLESVSFAVNS